MGAQQIKSYNEQLMEQQEWCMKRITNEVVSEQTNVRLNTVMHNQSFSSVSSSRQCITVADFAKIKVESTSDDTSEAETLGKKVKIEDRNIPERSNECTTVVSKDNSDVVIRESCVEFNSIPPFSIESKKELLATNAECRVITVLQDEAILPLSCEPNAEEVEYSTQSEVAADSQFNKNSQNCVVVEEESNKLLPKAENEGKSLKSNGTKLVRNPLAFLKKNCHNNRDQVKDLNITIKPEQKVIGEELESTIKVELELQPIKLNELIIKTEDPPVAETKEEILRDSILYQTCLSYNLDSSLDVNLSDDGTDLDAFTAKQSSEDAISNITLATAPESVKYFPTYEITSEEDDVITFEKSHLNASPKPRKKRTAFKKNIKEYQLCKKQHFQKKQIKNRQQAKSLDKAKTKKKTIKKHANKDTAYKTSITKRSTLQNLPKTAIKTRKNNTKKAVPKKTEHSSEVEFPKPFKFETEIMPKDQNVLVDLPKPMMFKREIAPKSKTKQSYLKPELQPFVRLKRLKSEELLVPLKTKHVRKTRKFKGTSETRRDFLIHQAYSLNPTIKCNRFSMDHEQSLYNQQHSLKSRYAASCSALTDIQNESGGDMESKYFSPQERYSSFFPSSTPDGSSMFSGPIDSGVSTSTPSTSHHNYDNKSLLLEIAAERAFINNHLMHFGHSPIQFDLYNDLNELSIFLKFVLGKDLL